jgi:two-component sensor histidine kinase
MQRGLDQRGTDAGLARALSPTGTFLALIDPPGRIAWSVNLPSSWAPPPSSDVAVDSDGAGHGFLHGEAADAVAAAIARVAETAEPCRLEVAVPVSDGMSWYAVWIDVSPFDASDAGRLVLTGLDITDQKNREQTLRTLLREVAHRSKNLLAIIQSIATQTGRRADTVEGFLARFRGRIQSMASTQDLVTSSNWRGADLHDLAHAQVGRYVIDPDLSIRLSGERPYLNPNAAMHIGLALHELAVNSVSFGALSSPEGTVSISLTGTARHSDLTLLWTERVPHASDINRQRRFGSAALERVVPAALGGTAELVIGPDLLTYRLTIPRANFVSG